MLKNMQQLHKLYAQVPGLLVHHTIFPYRYIDPKTGEEKEERLLPSDLLVYAIIYLNSDFKEGKGLGTSHRMSAADIEAELRPEPDAKPILERRSIYRSMGRLRRGGFIYAKETPHSKSVWKITSPGSLPSRRRIVEDQIETRKLKRGEAELEILKNTAESEACNAESQEFQNEKD